jgi:excisionase family DNA binding protein
VQPIDNGGDEDIGTFLSIEEAADLLRVKVTTIRWLRQETRFIPATRMGGRLVWYLSDVEAWEGCIARTRLHDGSEAREGRQDPIPARVKSHAYRILNPMFRSVRVSLATCPVRCGFTCP